MTTQGNKGNRAREAGRNKIRQLGLKQQRKNREAEIAKIIEQLERYEVSGLRRVPFGIKKSKAQLLKEFKNLMGIDYRDYRGITQRYSRSKEDPLASATAGFRTTKQKNIKEGKGAELDAGRNIPLTSSRQKDKKPTPFLNEKKILGEGMPSPLTSKQRLDTVRQNVNKMSPEEKEAGRKRNQAIKKEIRNFGRRETDAGMEGVLDTQSILLEGDKYVSPDFSPDRDRLERSIKSAPEDKNIVEQLVSKLLGRNIRFEDIPDDDPDFDQGLKSEGHIAYPAGRPDLRMGGMTARSGATTKFKKPLGMKGGGNITRAQRQRIARIMQDYKQKKARKSNGKRTNR
jgi:hypothetical protein|tara:strand:+ start:683 stop:1711 length:1029 start_codon:yes stop_codon:yes gene_type:complete